FPRRELVEKYSSSYRYEWHFGVSSIRTSVGCPFKCSFCSVDALSGGKYLKRSVENIVSELETITSRVVYFTDDESMIEYERMFLLAEMIQRAGNKKK
ncbi:MAG: radical SAM protein, partial [bacterium]|nr:radical SAM protein [bacterium]